MSKKSSRYDPYQSPPADLDDAPEGEPIGDEPAPDSRAWEDQEDYPHPPPPWPTAAPPGSYEREQVMAWRAANGYELFHPADCKDLPDNQGYVPHVTGNGFATRGTLLEQDRHGRSQEAPGAQDKPVHKPYDSAERKLSKARFNDGRQGEYTRRKRRKDSADRARRNGDPELAAEIERLWDALPDARRDNRGQWCLWGVPPVELQDAVRDDSGQWSFWPLIVSGD
jgi:hypothetical protein